MSSEVQGYIKKIEAAKQAIRNQRKDSDQLHSQTKRDMLRSLAEDYFDTVRPSVLAPSQQDSDVAEVDAVMQELVELCHKRSTIRTYCALLSAIRGALIRVDSRRVSAKSRFIEVPEFGDVDTLILSTLDAVVRSARNSYQQALIDLNGSDRLSWRGPATDLREALRETLDHFAPDDLVTKEPGFKLEPNTAGPTMKQKVRFVLKARRQSKSQTGTAESAVGAVEEAFGSFVRSVYTRSSVSTHVATSRNEVVRIRELVRVVLSEVLEIRT